MTILRKSSNEAATTATATTTFGFEQLSQIKRPYSVFSNRSTRLNSAVDLSIEYVDKNEMNESPRRYLIETYKANEAMFKQQQQKSQQIVLKKKPDTSLGFNPTVPGSRNDKFSVVNKLLASREAFPDKLITKEACKDYLKNLRAKQESEKAQVISLANGIKGENKHKFEFYLQHYDKEVLKTSRQPTAVQRKEAFVDRTSVIASAAPSIASKVFSTQKSVASSAVPKTPLNTRELLPKLLNSIRITNFSNSYNDKKRPLKELQRTQSQKMSKLSDNDENTRENTQTTIQYNREKSRFTDNSLLSISESSETLVGDDEFEIELDRKILDDVNDELVDASKTTFTSEMTVSTLNSEQKRNYKTQWPTVDEIEKLLGMKIKPPEPPKVEEVKEEEPVVDAKVKGKKSALKKKPGDKTPLSATKKPLKSATSLVEQDKEVTTPTPQPPPPPAPESLQSVTEIKSEIAVQLETNDVQTPLHQAPIIKVENELPKSLCPSSLKFSKKLGVRVWIENSNFESSLKTAPLI